VFLHQRFYSRAFAFQERVQDRVMLTMRIAKHRALPLPGRFVKHDWTIACWVVSFMSTCAVWRKYSEMLTPAPRTFSELRLHSFAI